MAEGRRLVMRRFRPVRVSDGNSLKLVVISGQDRFVQLGRVTDDDVDGDLPAHTSSSSGDGSISWQSEDLACMRAALDDTPGAALWPWRRRRMPDSL